MFTPDQERAASELLRVCKPGGTIGLTSWTPDGFVGQWFPIIARYAPPPPELKPPSRWGTEEGLQELFADRITSLRCTRRAFFFRYRSVQHWLDYFRAYFGPTRRTFEALDPAGQAQFAQDLVELVGRYNHACDQTMVAPGDYLEMVATRC